MRDILNSDDSCPGAQFDTNNHQKIEKNENWSKTRLVGNTLETL